MKIEDKTKTMEPCEYIEIWALNEAGALAFFGLNPGACEVVVLKAAPETEREKEKYLSTAKCYGIKVNGIKVKSS